MTCTTRNDRGILPRGRKSCRYYEIWLPTGFTLVANYKSPTIVDKESQSQKIV